MTTDDRPLLSVDDLTVVHGADRPEPVELVRGVSLTARRGEAIGIVGESGSGKSLTVLSLIGLLAPALQARGSAKLDGLELIGCPEKQFSDLRGERVSMVFQDPMTGLNPVRKIGSLLGEAVRRHQRVNRREARQQAIDMLARVGIPSPGERVDAYPHELSGGQRQRVMIALALLNDPDLILADEPTTALDTTIQAQIMSLLREQTHDAALILITHDLGVAAELCDRISVMYAGKIVEEGPTREVLDGARHPYTVALLAAAPNFDRSRTLAAIPGTPPSPFARPAGCAFAPRCPNAVDRCLTDEPPLVDSADGGTRLACWNPHE
ncbi:MAG: ABC transporter ATP-binding protein [Ilumatobacter fluminis]|uniref:ABC transporter ATP-binding protein n=1 Tax=Ilumatobacter fluminis TaxID=467091 RepID=UPI0032F045BC